VAETVRFRALRRLDYARGLVALTELARAWDGPEFSYGPMSITGMEQQGIVISGEDVTGPAGLIARDPAFFEVPA
jgi:hypothetical protein